MCTPFGAEAARGQRDGAVCLGTAGQTLAELLAQEADLEAVVAAAEGSRGGASAGMPGYPPRPLGQHLADALARHAAERAAGGV